MFELVVGSWALFVFTFFEPTGIKPNRRIVKKYKVKKSSIILKIIGWGIADKDSLDYWRAVPRFATFIIAVIISLLGLLDFILGGVIEGFLSDSLTTVFLLGLFGIYLIYFFLITIWWDKARTLEDKNEREKGYMPDDLYELEEELRKLRKEEKKEIKKQKRKQDKKK